MKRIWSRACDSAPTFDFSLKQWNILAQSLAVNGGFILCPPSALEWENRAPLITQEILHSSPDLILLEEVDCFTHLEEHLATYNYKGTFVPKPSSPCLKFQDNIGPDGNAIFYLKSKFSLIGEGFCVLTLEDGSPTNSTVVWKHLNHKDTNNNLLVLATHLKAKESPECVETRRQQGISLNNIINKMVKEFGTKNVVIAGDFNAEEEEPVHEVVRKGSRLESAYKKVMGRESDYTTWKVREVGKDKKRTIDYIMFTEEGMEVKDVLEVPVEEEIGENRLPNVGYPSDHVSIMAKFSFVK